MVGIGSIVEIAFGKFPIGYIVGNYGNGFIILFRNGMVDSYSYIDAEAFLIQIGFLNLHYIYISDEQLGRDYSSNTFDAVFERVFKEEEKRADGTPQTLLINNLNAETEKQY
jgi:hypothetical protein